MDPGNNNYINTIARANFPPYGRDFPGGVPTGRFSNGKIPTDFVAEELGIKELVPPYLDPNLQINDLLTGVSFASGAAGFDPTSASLVNALSLEDQLNLFKEYTNKLKAAVGENQTSYIVAQSAYVIAAGSNDITNTYFSLPSKRLQYTIDTYTDFVVSKASSFVQELYALGARRIGIISAPPCGCLPSQRTTRGGLLRPCAEELNQASSLYNQKLGNEFKSLNQKLVDSKLVFLDVYNLLLNLIRDPSHSGFEVVDRGCCGTGKIEATILCNRFDPGTCTDASKYLFWDAFHPSETASKRLVHQLLSQSIEEFF